MVLGDCPVLGFRLPWFWLCCSDVGGYNSEGTERHSINTSLALDADSALSRFKHCLCKNAAQRVSECFTEDSGCVELLYKFPVLRLPLTLSPVSLLFLPETSIRILVSNPPAPSLYTHVFIRWCIFFFSVFLVSEHLRVLESRSHLKTFIKKKKNWSRRM